MSTSVRIQTGGIEPILVQETADLTGLTDISVRVRRESDNQFLDFSDLTFKAAGHTSINSAALAEVSATNAPGLYVLTGGLDLSTITNMAADETLHVVAVQTVGTDAALPAPGEIKVGQLADDIKVILGVSAKSNAVWDNFVYTPVTGFLLSVRIRVFATAADANAATLGAADDADGETFRVNLTGGANGTFPSLPDSIRSILSP